MPLKSSRLLRERAAAGVVVCRTHGANCPKHPDHPVVRGGEPDTELAEMVRTGRLLHKMQELADAGYELPEEFTRGDGDRPKGDRVREFFERYGLGKHFPPDGHEYPKECKTRKLSDDELRQRREHADAVRAARKKNQPPPSWGTWRDAELAEMIRKERPAWEQRRAVEKAERVKRLRDDAELARKMREALETWINSPPRNSRHTQDVREGYGNAVPEFEEEE